MSKMYWNEISGTKYLLNQSVKTVVVTHVFLLTFIGLSIDRLSFIAQVLSALLQNKNFTRPF